MLFNAVGFGGSSSNIVQNQSELVTPPELLQNIPNDETRKVIILFKNDKWVRTAGDVMYLSVDKVE